MLFVLGGDESLYSVPQTGPTGPVAFGPKTTWMAVRCRQPEEVAAILDIQAGEQMPWKEGIEEARASRYCVFVSPAVQDWTFVVGSRPETYFRSNSLLSLRTSTAIMSERFGDAQGFVTQRGCEYHNWVRAEAGKIIRSFAYGHLDGLLDDWGPLTEAEKGIPFFPETEGRLASRRK